MAKTLILKTKMDNSRFDAQIRAVKDELDKLTQELDAIRRAKPYDKQKEDIIDYEKKIEKLINSLVKLEEKQNSVNGGINGQGLKKTIAKVGKWSLALMGVRTVYSGIRSIVNTVSQYNSEIAGKLETMRYSLAMAFMPVVEIIVNLLYKAMQYADYIAQKWFKTSLFSKASDKSIKSIASSMKKLAGYDTANVLTNNGTSGGGAISSIAPLEEGNIPKWVDWIAKNGDRVMSILLGIGSALLLIKLKVSRIKALGIEMVVYALVDGFQNLKKLIESPSIKHLTNLIMDIGIGITGLGLVIASSPAIVIGAAVSIVAVCLKYYNEILGLFDKAINYLQGDFRNKIKSSFGIVGTVIVDVVTSAIRLARTQIENFFGGIRQMCNGIVLLFKGDFKAGIVEVFTGIANVMLAPFNLVIAAVNELIKGLNKIKIEVPGWVPGIGGNKWGVSIPTLKQIKLKEGGILNKPGTGVPVGANAIAGESGREAYIPLTDEAALEEIGNAIGRHCNITVNFTEKIDSRVLKRIIKKATDNDDFIGNG